MPIVPTRLGNLLITSAVLASPSPTPKKPIAIKHQNFVMHLLSFLDAHSGSIQAITAVILVVVTVIYTILTRSMAKAARDALRPYVYLDFLFPGGSGTMMTVVVGNSGSKAAANVRVRLVNASKYERELTELFQSLPLASGVGQLSPGTTRKYPLVIPVRLWQPPGPAPVLDFEITYHDGGHKISDTQQIDVEGYRASSVESEDQLDKIASELHTIASHTSMENRISRYTGQCPYCRKGIAASATRCPNCLEWLPGNRESWRSRVRRIRREHN